MRRLLAAAAVFLTGCQTAPRTLPAGTDVYHGFTLIDPATKTVRSDAWLTVREGRIVETGQGRPPSSADPARLHDLGGRFVLPGFIDAHAHITHTGMQKFEVKDGVVSVRMDSVDKYTQHNARIALARGVTTVRNPGGDTEANARYDRMIASGEWIGPQALHAGAVIEPPPFSGGSFAYPRSEAAWDAEAARQKALGMTYFKLYVDLSEEELATGIRAAHRHGLKAIAHLNTVSWMRAIELGIDGLEHALPTSPDLLDPARRADYVAGLGRDSRFMYRWFEQADLDGPLVRALIAKLAERKIPLNMTLIVNELVYNLDRIDAVTPPIEREDTPPEVLAVYLPQLKASATGWTPQDFERARAVMPKVLRFAKLLHEAGAAMMIGTDAGGGAYYYRELALHREAGISAWDVLRMATSDTADIMGLGKRIGRIARGYEADLVILDANPLTATVDGGQVHGVLNNGVYLLSADLRRR